MTKETAFIHGKATLGRFGLQSCFFQSLEDFPNVIQVLSPGIAEDDDVVDVCRCILKMRR